MGQYERDQKPHGVPAKSIKPWQLPYLLNQGPSAEIFQSLWQADAPGQEHASWEEKIPSRGILFWDIEYYHNFEPSRALSNPWDVFSRLEPVYQTMQEVLGNYGINSMAVMSGRGYHFVTQVPYYAPAMERLIEAGGTLEPDIGKVQSTVTFDSKRDRPIPPLSQIAFKGATRLQQFVFNKVQRETQERTNLPINISDMGYEGISLDNTTMVRHVGSGKMGVMGSLYVKPVLFDYYNSGDRRLILRIPRSVNGRELMPVNDALNTRLSYSRTAEFFRDIPGAMPDGSEGVEKLFRDYQRSGLRRLHMAIDAEQGDQRSDWWRTYRNYDGIAQNIPGMSEIIAEANPRLLQPETLNYALNALFDSWGGKREPKVAGHVAGFLCAVYEDGRFNWGRRFTRHEIARAHALGWTQMILGQRSEFGTD